MAKKMLINALHPEEARVAIVEDGILVELDIETAGHEQTRSNVYKGVVVRVEPALQAAFVDIGLKKLGFLQMGEIHPDYWQWRDDVAEDQRHRRPRIQEILRRNQELIVQVEKGERDTKGAALTTYLSLPGRYMVLMPASDSAGISRKVESDAERKKLKELVGELTIPEGIGYILRTEAVGRTKRELTKDLQYLLKLYKEIQTKGKKTKAPALIYQESDLVIRTIRDYFNSDIDEVLVDSPEVYEQARTFLKGIMPKYEKLVKLHQEKRPIFSRYQLEEQIDLIYEKKVPLKSGGSIFIEPTEALVSIDVNSGKSTGERGVEDTAFKTNMEAAEEAARQLRLRDLGGLIVLDFIDMRDKKHKSEVEKTLKNALKADKARVTVDRISQFGMLEMSRQRIKPTIEHASYLECPHCSGKGKVKSVEAMALSFLRKVHAAASKGTVAEVLGSLPLEVAYYLLNRKKQELAQIETDYDIEVTVKGKPSFTMNQMEVELLRREKAAHPEGGAEPVIEPREGKRVAPRAPIVKEIAEAEAVAVEPAGPGKKRKRRRGKKKGHGAEAPLEERIDGEEEEGVEEVEAAAEHGTEAAHGEGVPDEQRKKRRRRRRRGKKPQLEGGQLSAEGAAQPAPEQSEAHPADVAVNADAPQEKGKKPRRQRKKKPAETMEAPAATMSHAGEPTPTEAAPKKGRRGGAKKAAPAEGTAPAVESLPAGEPADKPKRPRAPRKKKEAPAAD
jgi:ribonuclease E